MSIFGAKGSLLRSFILIQLGLTALVLLTAISSWSKYGMTLPLELYIPLFFMGLSVFLTFLLSLRNLGRYPSVHK